MGTKSSLHVIQLELANDMGYRWKYLVMLQVVKSCGVDSFNAYSCEMPVCCMTQWITPPEKSAVYCHSLLLPAITRLLRLVVVVV